MQPIKHSNQILHTPQTTSLTYDRDKTKWLFFKHSSQKIYCDLNRICEVEDSAAEWYEAQYYLQNDLFDLAFLQDVFKIIDLKYTGVDGSVCKCQLLAKSSGFISGDELCGISIRVIDSQREICNEVKRIGFIRDRENELQLRVGDTLVLYISTSVS